MESWLSCRRHSPMVLYQFRLVILHPIREVGSWQTFLATVIPSTFLGPVFRSALALPRPGCNPKIFSPILFRCSTLLFLCQVVHRDVKTLGSHPLRELQCLRRCYTT